jgi:ABC-type sugar transport system permease subunit
LRWARDRFNGPRFFTAPALIGVAAVIVFSWLFTLCISVHDRKVSGATTFTGMANDPKILVDDRVQ